MNRRFLLQRVLPFVVSAGTLTWVLGSIDLSQLGAALNWRVLAFLVPALLAYGAVTLVIEAASILRVIGSVPPDFSGWTAARIKSASYLLAIVNYALGQAALTVLLRRRAGIGLGESASVVLLISVTDLMVVLGLGTAAAVFAETGGFAMRVGVVAVLAVAFFGGMALLRAPGSLGPLERLRSLAVFDALRRAPLRRLAELALLRFVFSCAFIALAGVTFWGFDLYPSISHLVLGMMILAVVGALPIAVAGLGTGQLAAVEVFEGVAPPGTLVALSLVLSAGMISLRALMGIVFAREFTREALQQSRAGSNVDEDLAFTGERLHQGNQLFAVDLARHEAAYQIAQQRMGRGRVLDLGCGSGYGTAALAASSLRAPVFGLDRVRPDAANRGDGGFVRADLAGIPFPRDAFELVVSFQVIEHFEDAQPYVNAIADLLHPDGAALITTPNLLMSDRVNPYHVHEYEADELAAALGTRFDEVEIRGIGASEPVHRYLEQRSRRIRRIMRLDPLGLRDRLPRGLVEWLFARFAVLVRSRTASGDGTPDVTWQDFPVGLADARCLDLLAICRRPR